MPQHWPAAINQSVLCSPFCPFCLGVCLLCCFFIQAAQRHTNSRTFSQPPRFSISQREEPRAVLFIVFRPMWVPSFIPGIKLSMERTYSTLKKTALPPSHLFLLIFPCETIVLSASCCLRLPFSEGARHHMNFSRNSLSALSLSVFEGLVSFFYICVFALHAFLPSFSLSDSFCLPWAGNECRAGRGCWRDSSQGRRHHILQSVTF